MRRKNLELACIYKHSGIERADSGDFFESQQSFDNKKKFVCPYLIYFSPFFSSFILFDKRQDK